MVEVENIDALDISSIENINVENTNKITNNVIIDHGILDSDFKWYCIRTYTGHEARVKQIIESEVKRLGLESMIGEVIIPQETVFEVRKGKRKTKTRNFLPGYIVIKAVISDEKKTKNKVLDIVGGVSGVISFVGRKNDPAQLQESEVKRIFMRAAERADVETIESAYTLNDPIKIIEGPFGGFAGVVKEITNEKQKLKVEVGILGRKTLVELDFSQVQFDKPQ